MNVTINVINEMKKLRTNVYSDRYTWVDELVQNCQRAKANHVIVTVTNTKIIIQDDGIGCTDPNSLFEKNVSGWDAYTTANENPFGEGFFSTIMAANLITVSSIGFTAVFDVLKMFRENNTDCIEVISNKRKSGFVITLENLMPGVYADVVANRFYDVGKYIKNPKIIINNKKVPYEGMEPNINKPFIHTFNNDYCSGWIRPHSYKTNDWDTAKIKCFAFDRLVKDSSEFYGIAGVITFKPNKITLRSPDRKDFVTDDLYFDAMDAIKKEIKKMYLKVVKTGTDTEIKNYDYLIERYVDINDYKKYIKFKFYSKKEKQNNVTIDVTDNDTITTHTINNDDVNYDNDFEVTTDIVNIAAKHINTVAVNQTGEKIDGRSDFGFYVKTDEIDEYSDVLGVALYYNIPVLEIRNSLEANVIKHKNNFKHISEINDSIQLNCKSTNAKPNTEYELRALKVLNTIMKLIGERENIFVICDVDMNKTLKLDNRQIEIEKVNALAVAYGDKIYIDRKYLNQYRNLTDDDTNLNNNDIRFVMCNLETISHELSHLLYGNEDNTKAHSDSIIYIMGRIIKAIYN
jgi:hypothetical protein